MQVNLIIKNIQLLIICNKNKYPDLYNSYVNDLEDVNPKKIKQMTEILIKLKLNIANIKQIGEQELQKLRDLFQIESLDSYEYDQTMELLFKTIDLIDANDELDKFVYDELLRNIHFFFDSKDYPIVSFSSLYLLLYYFYKKNI